MYYCVTSILLQKIMHITEQLSAGMLHVHLSVGDILWGQNYCSNSGAFQKPIAGMTSQIRLLWLISISSWLYRLMAWQGTQGLNENTQSLEVLVVVEPF